jgi:membrane fusion protein, multidrug efflux system
VRAGRTSTLGFRHAGEVRHIHVQEGDTIAAGALLAELDAEPLRAAREQALAGLRHAEAQLLVAEAAVELARETTRRHQDLLEKGHTSAQRFDEVRLDLAAREAQVNVAQAERARAQAGLRVADVDLDRSRLLAPYPARIQTRHADEGAMLVPGQAVLRIVEEGRREARIGLPVEVAGTLETGASYTFRNGGDTLHGTLLHLLPEVDARTRTLTALFDLPHSESALPAGSLIELILTRPIADAGFWLPLAALSEAQRGLWSVFVVVSDGNDDRIERRLVEVLHSAENRVFVRGTLADGDAVVATGTQRIVPGQVVVAGAGR